MAFWRKLFDKNKGSSQEEAPPSRPSIAEMRQEALRDVRVQVLLHEIEEKTGKRPAWSFYTDGLLRHGQREIVITLPLLPGETAEQPPEDPVRLFAQIAELAHRGQSLNVGHVLDFGTQSVLGGRAMVFTKAVHQENVPVPAGALAGILLFEEEFQAIQKVGSSRVLARLGLHFGYFPTLLWSDRKRAQLPLVREASQSILASMGSLIADGSTSIKQGQTVTFTLSPSLQTTIQNLAANSPICIRTHVHDHADACLVWTPGQASTQAITPPRSQGKMVSGCFAIFMGHPEANEIRLIEDGFALMLSPASWNQVRMALCEKREFDLPSCGELNFSLRWLVPQALPVSSSKIVV
jgi:hypothetical protein